MKLHIRLFVVLCLFCTCSFATSTTWQPINPGLEYTSLKGFSDFPNGKIHAFRIDLSHYEFRVAHVPDDSSSEIAFHRLMKMQDAVIATNGGFFTPDLKPLGLRINQEKVLNPLKHVSWWSIFFIQNNQPFIITPQMYQPNFKPSFAIQAGPPLLINNQVPRLKPDIDFRTALCITGSKKIILLITENLLLSTRELANVMRSPQNKGGLDCIHALNLDGGYSTQLYTEMPNISLQVPSFALVADAILVVPK